MVVPVAIEYCSFASLFAHVRFYNVHISIVGLYFTGDHIITCAVTDLTVGSLSGTLRFTEAVNNKTEHLTFSCVDFLL